MFDIDPRKLKSENYTKKSWGHKITIGSNPHYRIDFLEIKKTGYCSWHYHHKEFNKFFVMHGTLLLYVHSRSGLEKKILGPEHKIVYFTIKPGDKHMFYARTDVQCIELVYTCASKNDIIRSFEGGINKQEDEIDLMLRNY